MKAQILKMERGIYRCAKDSWIKILSCIQILEESMDHKITLLLILKHDMSVRVDQCDGSLANCYEFILQGCLGSSFNLIVWRL